MKKPIKEVWQDWWERSKVKVISDMYTPTNDPTHLTRILEIQNYFHKAFCEGAEAQQNEVLDLREQLEKVTRTLLGIEGIFMDFSVKFNRNDPQSSMEQLIKAAVGKAMNASEDPVIPVQAQEKQWLPKVGEEFEFTANIFLEYEKATAEAYSPGKEVILLSQIDSDGDKTYCHWAVSSIYIRPVRDDKIDFIKLISKVFIDNCQNSGGIWNDKGYLAIYDLLIESGVDLTPLLGKQKD
jgi:hypothetical protein